MININWEQLCEAFGDYTGSRYYFFNKKTGEILILSEYMSEEIKKEIKKRVKGSEYKDYLLIPSITSRESFKMMEEFIESLGDDKLRVKLQEAIKGEAPFKKFKEIAYKNPEDRRKWLNFRKEKLTKMAERWLKKEKVI